MLAGLQRLRLALKKQNKPDVDGFPAAVRAVGVRVFGGNDCKILTTQWQVLLDQLANDDLVLRNGGLGLARVDPLSPTPGVQHAEHLAVHPQQRITMAIFGVQDTKPQ